MFTLLTIPPAPEARFPRCHQFQGPDRVPILGVVSVSGEGTSGFPGTLFILGGGGLGALPHCVKFCPGTSSPA